MADTSALAYARLLSLVDPFGRPSLFFVCSVVEVFEDIDGNEVALVLFKVRSVVVACSTEGIGTVVLTSDGVIATVLRVVEVVSGQIV